jgi:primosomal protein N' (replication factor Y)
VARVRPLRLKSEVFRQEETDVADNNPVAQVWVDNGVYHLDQSFDYAIPLSMDASIRIGIRVEVPFNGKSCEGLVIGRTPGSSGKPKNIFKVVSNVPVANSTSIDLIRASARRWAAHPYDIIRSAIPPRVAAVERESWIRKSWTRDSNSVVSGKPRRVFYHLPPSVDRMTSINDFLGEFRQNGSVLLILPDSRLAGKIHSANPGSVLLDSQSDRTERYRNFLRASQTSGALVIGTRSAIFAPVAHLSAIVIFDEGSENNYEKRSPGWNVRDIAVLRSQHEKVSLSFLGYSPSSEIARLIEIKWVEYRSHRTKVAVKNFSQNFSELLPGRIISEIRAGLKDGSILFIVPRKGYSQAISCSHCRNLALCECGGKLSKSSMKAAPQCVMCGKIESEWRCTWCQGVTPFLIGRGSQRFAQEIGRHFRESQSSHLKVNTSLKMLPIFTASLSQLLVQSHPEMTDIRALLFLKEIHISTKVMCELPNVLVSLSFRQLRTCPKTVFYSRY